MTLSIGLALMTGNEELGLTEGEGSTVVTPTVQEAIELAVENEVAEATVELQELKADVEEITSVTEEVVERTEELEEIVEGVESLISGNYNPVAAKHLLSRGGVINAKLGGRNTAIAGNEDFDDFGSVQSTLVAGVEGFTDTIKKAGAVVINFIKKIYNVIKNFFIGLFNKNKALTNRAKSLKERLGKDGVEVKEKIKLGQWSRYGVKEISNAAAATVDTALKQCDALDGLTARIRDIATGKVTPSTFGGLYDALVDKYAGAGGKTDDKGNNVAQRITVTGGMRTIVTYYTGKFDTLENCVKAVSVLSMGTGKDPDFTVGKDEIATPSSLADLRKIVDNVIANLSSARVEKLANKFADSERNKVIGAINAVNNNPDEDKAKEIKLTCRLVQLLTSKCASFSQKTTSGIEDYCAASLAYVSTCIK